MTPILLTFGQSNAQGFESGINSFLKDNEDVQFEQIQASIGATGLVGETAAWNVIVDDEADSLGSAYLSMIAEIDEKLAETPDAYIAAAVWSQGEADSKPWLYPGYAEAAQALFEETYDYIGYEFPIVMLGLSDYQRASPDQEESLNRIEGVNEQQQLVAETMENVHYLDTDEIFAAAGLSQEEVMHDDGIHFNLVGSMARVDAVLAKAEIRTVLGLEPLEQPEDDEDVVPEEEAAETSSNDTGSEDSSQEQESSEPNPVSVSDPDPVTTVDESGQDDVSTQEQAAEEPVVSTQESETEEPAVLADEVVAETIHMQAGAATTSSEDQSDPIEDSEDSGQASESETSSGMFLGLSALGAALGSFILPILGLLSMLATSRGKTSASASDDTSENASPTAVKGISLEEVIPITETISEDGFQSADFDMEDEDNSLIF